jgi:hypothetical protein
MKYIIMIREVLCQALLASHLTRRGRWQSAVKLMGK